jgi:hypothetical protein
MAAVAALLVERQPNSRVPVNAGDSILGLS